MYFLEADQVYSSKVALKHYSLDIKEIFFSTFGGGGGGDAI